MVAGGGVVCVRAVVGWPPLPSGIKNIFQPGWTHPRLDASGEGAAPPLLDPPPWDPVASILGWPRRPCIKRFFLWYRSYSSSSTPENNLLLRISIRPGHDDF